MKTLNTTTALLLSLLLSTALIAQPGKGHKTCTGKGMAEQAHKCCKKDSTHVGAKETNKKKCCKH